MYRLFLLLVFPLTTLAKVAASCFSYGNTTNSSNFGETFNDTIKLSTDQMSLDYRVSKLIVCMNSKGSRIEGMQISLADLKNGTSFPSTMIGDMNSRGLNCSLQKIDTQSDFLQTVRISYNVSGIQGLQFETSKN
jgi:hypothetical protein